MTKRKRNRSAPKPRVDEIRVSFDRDVVITGMAAPGGEGAFQFFGEDGRPLVPNYIEVGTGYARKKPGLKILRRMVANPQAIFLEPTRTLARFATILAVDTNTKTIDGVQVSVSASLLIRDLRVESSGEWKAVSHEQPPYEFHEATTSPELVGWHNILARALESRVEEPVALIVDAELDRLTRFNRREAPIVGGLMLPDGCELIYSSGDRGRTEFVGNAAIAQCDQLATSILGRIDSEPALRAWTNVMEPSPWVKRHRYWIKSK